MRSSVNRRTFIGSVAGSLIAAPRIARAQPAQRIPRIAYLSAFSQAGAEIFAGDLRAELRKLGWIDGGNVVLLAPKAADNRHDRLSALVAEVVGSNPDVITARGAPTIRILKGAKPADLRSSNPQSSN